MIFKTTFISFLAFTTTAYAEPPKVCDDAYKCSHSSLGLVASKEDGAETYLPIMQNAAQIFEKHFGKKPSLTALTLGGSAPDTFKDALKENGYTTIMPWLTPDQKSKLVAGNIRKQIKAQQPSLPDATVDTIVAEQVEKLKKQGAVQSGDLEKGVLAHELAHMWFHHAYYPDSEPDGEPQYGSDAPDWLDELSAVLAENEAVTKGRLKALEKLAASGNFDAFWPLEEYFQMEHPLFRQVTKIREQASKPKVSSSIMIKNLDDFDLGENARNPADFYAQSRGLADYLMDKSGNPAIFHEIASHISSGHSMVSWLAKNGKQHNIPSSITELEADWHTWMKDYYAS